MRSIRIKTRQEDAFLVIYNDTHAFSINELDDFWSTLDKMRSSFFVKTYLYGDDEIEARLETEKTKISLIYKYFYYGCDDKDIIALVDYLEKRFEKIVIDQGDWQTYVKLDDFEITLRQNEDYFYDMLIDKIKKIADELKRKTKT